MNKAEVLEKSRSEKRDEREEQIIEKSSRWALVTCLIAMIICGIIRRRRGENIQDIYFIINSCVTTSFIYRYFKDKSKAYLAIGILFLIVSIMMFIDFLGYLI